VAKARSPKQLASDRKRSLAMKGTRPAFLKAKSSSKKRSSVAKKKNTHTKKREITIPLAIVIPAAIPIVKAVTFDPRTGRNGVAFDRTAEGAKQTFRSLGRAYTGYDMDTGAFDLTDPAITYGTLILGAIGHTLAAKANRLLGQSQIPLIRI